jgi:hypothetical protein
MTTDKNKIWKLYEHRILNEQDAPNPNAQPAPPSANPAGQEKPRQPNVQRRAQRRAQAKKRSAPPAAAVTPEQVPESPPITNFGGPGSSDRFASLPSPVETGTIKINPTVAYSPGSFKKPELTPNATANPTAPSGLTNLILFAASEKTINSVLSLPSDIELFVSL